MIFFFFFFSSRRRHTICALVTGVQTCALPIYALRDAMRRLLATGRATAFAHRMERGGRLFRFAHHLHLERDSEGHVTGVAATVEDLEEASVERRASSHFDQLTRLANAASFRNWVDRKSTRLNSSH